MKNLLSPWYILVVNTLPITILIFLYLGQFAIIRTLLKSENIYYWLLFGVCFGSIILFNFCYALYLIVREKSVSAIYAFLLLVSHICTVYFYTIYGLDIIPFTVPRWLLTGNMSLHVGTFLMPTMAYSLWALVVISVLKIKYLSKIRDFTTALIIPLSWFFFFLVILPLWQPFNEDFGFHIFLISAISSIILFLFFFIRGIYTLAVEHVQFWQNHQLFWKIPMTIFLPIIGLLINNGVVDSIFSSTNGIFGNFGNPWFYLLAVVNGVLICLPNAHSPNYRLLLFFGRSITFPFTFYFFVVFLPYLPLSVIAIVFLGLGFLMLMPLFLFILHLIILWEDFKYLREYNLLGLARAGLIAGVLILPLLITRNYLQDKSTLHNALSSIYEPDYSRHDKVNKRSLKQTLHHVKQNNNKFNRSRSGNMTPYLSALFNWLVLDNLTLSDKRINKIEQVYFDKDKPLRRAATARIGVTKISDINVRSEYNSEKELWLTWVDLQITNDSNFRQLEYVSKFNLPEDCWISDYYLFVNGIKKKGILSEKKSAKWVYAQITATKRDPGILYYLNPREIAFRVFPFSARMVRKTGIEFIHREPVCLNIDGNSIQLGNEDQHDNLSFENNDVIYLTSSDKDKLPRIKRRPYFHFILDSSKGQKEYAYNVHKRVVDLKINFPELYNNAEFSMTGSDIASASEKSTWQDQYLSQDFSGGFYLDKAIRKILYSNYKKNDETYPIIVAVTEDLDQAILDQNFLDMNITYPDNSIFYHLDTFGNLIPHSLNSNPRIALKDDDFYFGNPVLEYKAENNSTYYLPDNQKPSIILKNDEFDYSHEQANEKSFLNAVMQQAKYISLGLHPENTSKGWLDLVRKSFQSQIMTPFTSYLVAENEAQEAMLRRKQDQILSSKHYMDLDEVVNRMSEPPLWIFFILLALIMGIKRRLSIFAQ